jgi:molecular chaperone GrpE
VVDKESKEIRIPVNVHSEDAAMESRMDSGTDPDSQQTEQERAEAEESKDQPETIDDFFKRVREEVQQDSERLSKADEIILALSEASDEPDSSWVENRAQTSRLLVNLAREAYENHDRWMRSVAELENYKKRSAQERSKLLKYNNENLLRDLLPVVDNIERALDAAYNAGESGPFIDGIKMIAQMFGETLDRYAAKPIEALGKKFDPKVHEAIAVVPMPDKEPDTVIEQLEKGYTYHDRLLRPSKVVVVSAEQNKDD